MKTTYKKISIVILSLSVVQGTFCLEQEDTATNYTAHKRAAGLFAALGLTTVGASKILKYRAQEREKDINEWKRGLNQAESDLAEGYKRVTVLENEIQKLNTEWNKATDALKAAEASLEKTEALKAKSAQLTEAQKAVLKLERSALFDTINKAKDAREILARRLEEAQNRLFSYQKNGLNLLETEVRRYNNPLSTVYPKKAHPLEIKANELVQKGYPKLSNMKSKFSLNQGLGSASNGPAYLGNQTAAEYAYLEKAQKMADAARAREATRAAQATEMSNSFKAAQQDIRRAAAVTRQEAQIAAQNMTNRALMGVRSTLNFAKKRL